MKTSNEFIARQCDQAGEVVEMGRSAEQAASAMPDCWVVVKNGRILGTHDEPAHIDGLHAVRYVPAIAQPVQPSQYDQTALELCDACGWKALIPGDCCLNCERDEMSDAAPPTDAERYQFLKAEAYEAVIPFGGKINGSRTAWITKFHVGSNFNEAIDAAIAASKGAA